MHPEAHSRDDRPQQRSRLLQLPGELRNEILRYVVTQPEPLDLCDAKAVFNIDVRVMYVCQQLRDEARSFLYHENILEVGIKTKGPVTSLQFSRHHWICEYTIKEVVNDATSVFLERFSHFQFRFDECRQLGSLRRVIGAIKHHFHEKHIKVIPPPLKERINAYQATSFLRVSPYTCINWPLSCLSVIRCASLSITSLVPDYDLIQHDNLINLVTSNKPVVDMVRDYDNAQHSARSLAKMLVPHGALQDFETLKDQLLKYLAAMCQSANMSDQNSFLVEQEDFERCYREIEDLQWRNM